MNNLNVNWFDLYKYKNDFILNKGFSLVNSFEFYRDLFPLGSLQNKDESFNNKGNIVGISIDKNERKNNKRFIIFDDFENLDNLVNVPFGLIAPVNYFGKNRSSDNARFLFAIAIDIDYVVEKNIRDLFFQIKNGLHAMPTYVVNSGRGLHLYYFLKEPIPLYKHYQKTLREFKEAMIERLWNDYTSSKKEKDMTGVLQGFRTVGSFSKLGKDYPVVAFKTGPRYTLEELKEFTPNYKGNLELKFPEKSKKNKKNLEYYKKNFPEWYQERIIEGKPKGNGRWTVKRDLYNWWKEKIKKEIVSGHRYFGIMTLAIYGQKCGIEFEEVERDALSFLELLEERTEEDNNHFTLDDIYTALDCYNEKYVRFPRKDLERITGVSMPANKRNGRKQEQHLVRARTVQIIDYPNGEWRNKKGKPIGTGTKENIVKEYIKKNPKSTMYRCQKDTGLSKNTIKKYWNLIKFDL